MIKLELKSTEIPTYQTLISPDTGAPNGINFGDINDMNQVSNMFHVITINSDDYDPNTYTSNNLQGWFNPTDTDHLNWYKQFVDKPPSKYTVQYTQTSETGGTAVLKKFRLYTYYKKYSSC